MSLKLILFAHLEVGIILTRNSDKNIDTCFQVLKLLQSWTCKNYYS